MPDRINSVGAGMPAAPTDETWRVDNTTRTIHLDDGYRITFDNREQAWSIHGPDGKQVRIWGDPHVFEGDGGRWDFKAQTTFELENGAKITCKTRLSGDGTVSFSDELFITDVDSDQAVHVTGIADDNVHISEVGGGAAGLDASVDDGYTVLEQGDVEDWSFFGDEVVRDLPFVDYATYLDLTTMRSDPPLTHRPDLENLPAEAARVGLSASSYLDDLFSQLERDLERRRDDAAEKRDAAKSKYDRRLYTDICNALDGDLDELRSDRTQDIAHDLALYNRIAYEACLEVKYNISLTSSDEPQKEATWSEAELRALDQELDHLPPDFTTFDYLLKQIRREILPAGSGGVNRGGVIALPEGAGAVRHAIIHEIGHDFDDENKRWSEFKSLSDWRDTTDQFTNISSDSTVDPVTKKEVYKPYDGSAVFKRDGQVYRDGDPIDLDGDGADDGIVQVHYGRAMVHGQGAAFVSKYAATNPRDDFAETFDAFFHDPENLKAQCPAKYAFMTQFTGQDPVTEAA